MLQKKEDEVTKKVTMEVEDTVYSVVGGVFSGMADYEIREKYGAGQELIDRVRAMLKDLLDRRPRP